MNKSISEKNMLKLLVKYLDWSKFKFFKKEIELHKEFVNKNPKQSDPNELFISEAQKFYDTNYQDIKSLRQTFDAVKQKVWNIHVFLNNVVHSI
jgi:hypothetical protein